MGSIIGPGSIGSIGYIIGAGVGLTGTGFGTG